MRTFQIFKLIKWEEDKNGVVTCNNLTLINFVLIKIGSTKESNLTNILLLIQVMY